jgi:hypothetical protein
MTYIIVIFLSGTKIINKRRDYIVTFTVTIVVSGY